MDTSHFKKDRKSRVDFIKQNIGVGNPIASFLVNRGHCRGPEIHTVTTTGIIIVQNFYTGDTITMLVGRPTQIKSLYFKHKKKPPEGLLKIAIEHSQKKYHLL